MSEMNSHYFYALELPLETKVKLKDICGQLRSSWMFKRWVYHQDLHITLAFLGGASEESLQDSIRKIESMLDCSAFSLTINHLGVFGKKDNPRIFWAGVDDEPLLRRARDIVYQACLATGFKLETRPFNPHITLARKWIGESVFSKQMLETNDPFFSKPLHFRAENIVLYKTHLGKEPKYEAIYSFSLNEKE